MTDATRELSVSLAEFLQLPPSAELLRYEVRRTIGEGGMGRVMLGFDQKLDREVAIKVILDDEGREDIAERFYREAKIAAALDHPNIIKIIDYSGPKLPRQYLVMERLQGHSLQHYLDSAQLSERIACVVVHEIALALAHAHAQGLVHRDVKPENVFIEPNGRVVLIDFGLAKGVLANASRQTFAASQTKLMGTPLFSAPEQLLGTFALSAKADLYSLGALMYYAVSQVTPFAGDSMTSLLAAIKDSEPDSLDAFVDVSPEYLRLTHALLSKDPAARPTTEQVVTQLRALLAKHAVVSVTSDVSQWAAAPALASRVSETVVAKPPQKPTFKTTQVLPEKPRNRVLPFAVSAVLLVVALIATLLMREKPQAIALPEPPPLAEPLPPVPTQGETEVRIVVKPWGKVTIDGKLMGMTPQLRDVKLPAGVHELVVTNPTLGERTVSLVLSGEAQRRVVIDFDEGK